MSMYDEFEEQKLEGLNEKIMEVVKSYQGDYTDTEVLKMLIIQSNLLLATYNVRYFLAFVVSCIEICLLIIWTMFLRRSATKKREK